MSPPQHAVRPHIGSAILPDTLTRTVRRHRATFTIFTFIGGGVFVLGLAIVYASVHWLHMNAQLAFLLSGFVSIEVNFLLNWKLTFRKRGTPFWTAAWRFHAWRLVTIPVNQGIFYVLIYLGMEYLLTTLATTAIFMVLNYLFCHRWAFPARLKLTTPEE